MVIAIHGVKLYAHYLHEVKHYAHCYTCSEALGSMLYKE